MTLRGRTLVASGAAIMLVGALLPRSSPADVPARMLENNNEVTITSADIATLTESIMFEVSRAD